MTEDIIIDIATQGILGAFLALALITIFFLYKEVRKEKDARIDDLKTILQTDTKEKVESRVTLDRILELLRSNFKE